MSEQKIVTLRNQPGNRGFVNIVKEVMELAKEGFVVDDTQVGIYTGPMTQGTWRIALTREVEGEEALHVLEDPKSTKADLLEYAKESGVDVPKDKKSPAAIKKFLKSQSESPKSEEPEEETPPVEEAKETEEERHSEEDPE